MSLSRKVARNTLVQIFGRVFGLFISLVTLNYIANHLVIDGSTLNGYGEYTIVFAYVSIIGTAADLGLFTLLVRDLTGKNRHEAGQLIGNALWFRLGLLIATFLIIAGLVHFLPYAAIVRSGILIGVIVAFFGLFWQVIAAIFQAQLVSEQIVINETVGKVVTVGLTIYFLKLGLGLIPIILANMAGTVVTLMLGLVASRRWAKLSFHFDIKVWRDYLPQFLPLALISILALVHFKIDTLILSLLKPEGDVGLYGLAYKVMEVVLIVPTIFSTNLLPIFSNPLNNNDVIALILRKANSLTALLALGAATYLFVFAPWIIVFLAHGDFLPAAVPMRILAFGMVSIFFSTLIVQAVIAVKEQRFLIPGYWLALGLNILLNLLIIPRYSYNGAALATLITEAILLGYIIYGTRRIFPRGIDWGFIFRSAVATGLAIAVLWPLANHYTVVMSHFELSPKLTQVRILLEGLLATAVVMAVSVLICFGGRLKRLQEIFVDAPGQ